MCYGDRQPPSLPQMLASVLLYIFLLHVHLDGRMLDLYRRVQVRFDDGGRS